MKSKTTLWAKILVIATFAIQAKGALAAWPFCDAELKKSMDIVIEAYKNIPDKTGLKQRREEFESLFINAKANPPTAEIRAYQLNRWTEQMAIESKHRNQNPQAFPSIVAYVNANLCFWKNVPGR